MALYERNTCSFIVKVWVEGMDQKEDNRLWRGHITHVFSAERRYFEHLDEVIAFIATYLERMGVKINRS